MQLPPLDCGRAADLVGRFAGLPVLVVGDVMLDRFIVGRVTRISPEAPVPVVRYQSEHLRLGGAANVAHNIAMLGGRPSLVGLVGAAPLIVDPKIPHLDRYAGATLVTPNHYEAEAALHRPVQTDEAACAAARDLRARVRCDALLITRGEHGMWLGATDVEGSIPAVAREVSDVTGAG